MTHESIENPPTLIMAERPDWSLFRTLDGLQQRVGVPARNLRQLVLKETTGHAPLAEEAEIPSALLPAEDTRVCDPLSLPPIVRHWLFVKKARERMARHMRRAGITF